ncbi:MAG: DNA-directed RNA polymerase subunit omega [Bdellovibrionales bacterium]|nr:DNA-directed RNA polymerase subunit omega [Bdellovibrionales bacterium]
MARISIEDCLEQVNNRFALVHLVSERARQLAKGSTSLVRSKNKHIVTALREVAADQITYANTLDEEKSAGV